MQTLIKNLFFFTKTDIIIWYKVINKVTEDMEMIYHID